MNPGKKNSSPCSTFSLQWWKKIYYPSSSLKETFYHTYLQQEKKLRSWCYVMLCARNKWDLCLQPCL